MKNEVQTVVFSTKHVKEIRAKVVATEKAPDGRVNLIVVRDENGQKMSVDSETPKTQE